MKSKLLFLIVLFVGFLTTSCTLDDDEIQSTEQGTGGIEDPVEPEDDPKPVYATGGIEDPVEPDIEN